MQEYMYVISYITSFRFYLKYGLTTTRGTDGGRKFGVKLPATFLRSTAETRLQLAHKMESVTTNRPAIRSIM